MANKKQTNNVIEQAQGDNWVMYLGDCVEVIKGIPDSSIDYCVSSPPFGNTYIYSDSANDMGNCTDDEEFMQHYGFLIHELWRVTVPGRLCSVHCKDLPLYMNRDGAAGLRDFPGAIVREFEKHGWVYHSRVTIWKDPVIEMQRTKNHGLLYKNFQVRGEVCRQGMADFVITFRKWDDSAEKEKEKPVIHNSNEFSLDVWQRWASPVWMDIDQTDVLNYQIAKEDKDEKHVCPLQLGVIKRCVELWTNKGDVVLSPFAGVGSEGYESLLAGRKFIGIELKKSYFELAIKYLKQAELEEVNSHYDLFSQAGVMVE